MGELKELSTQRHKLAARDIFECGGKSLYSLVEAQSVVLVCCVFIATIVHGVG
jgi:hypothetical protein